MPTSAMPPPLRSALGRSSVWTRGTAMLLATAAVYLYEGGDEPIGRRLRAHVHGQRHRPAMRSSDRLPPAPPAPPPPPLSQPSSGSGRWWRQKPSDAKRQPNFLLIFFDDSGYGDLGVNRPDKPSHTPFLDRLSRSGINLQSFYVPASICTPSRAALLTGRHGQRTGVTGHVSPRSQHGLPKTETTMATMLKAQGYSTLMIGKWHLGHTPGHLPTDHGFQVRHTRSTEYYAIPSSQ